MNIKRRGDAGEHAVGAETAGGAKSRRAVVIYMLTLAVAVVALILLSYFLHQRDSTALDTLHRQNTTAQEDILQLQNENQKLLEDNSALQIELEGRESELAELEKRITALEDELKKTVTDKDDEIKKLQTEYAALREQYDALAADNQE